MFACRLPTRKHSPRNSDIAKRFKATLNGVLMRAQGRSDRYFHSKDISSHEVQTLRNLSFR